jgi:hypothetical protein
MIGKKFKQIFGSEKFQTAAQGAVQGAVTAVQKKEEEKKKKAEIRKEYIVAAAIIIAALVGRR